MKRYRVVRDCAGFVGKKKWREGDIVEVEDDVKLPRFFELVSGDYKKSEKPEANPQLPLSQMHRTLKVTNGFAVGAKEAEVRVQRTEGDVKPGTVPESEKPEANKAEKDKKK